MRFYEVGHQHPSDSSYNGRDHSIELLCSVNVFDQRFELLMGHFIVALRLNQYLSLRASSVLTLRFRDDISREGVGRKAATLYGRKQETQRQQASAQITQVFPLLARALLCAKYLQL